MYRSVPRGPRGRRRGLTSPARGHRLAQPLELYLRNASTFSPGGTCGAIPSRPLRRRSWCALLGLRPGQPRGRLARSRHSRRRRAERRWEPRAPALHPSPTGWAGWAGVAARLRVRASSPQVGGQEQKRAVTPEADTSGPGPPPVQGTSASLQCVRLAARRPVPPALSSDRAPRDSAPAPSRGLGPPALRPQRTAPPQSVFRSGHYAARAHTDTRTLSHTHSHTHTMPSAAPTPALPLSVSGAPRAILYLPLPGGGWVTSPHTRAAGRKGEAARVPWTAGTGQVPGPRRSAGRRRAAGAGQGAGPAEGWVRARGRGGGRGAAEERGARLLRSGDGSHCPAPSRSSRAASPTRGARQVLSRPAPGPIPPSPGLWVPSSSLSSSPSHVRAGSGVSPDFL